MYEAMQEKFAALLIHVHYDFEDSHKYHDRIFRRGEGKFAPYFIMFIA
jgi:hypothetical protein